MRECVGKVTHYFNRLGVAVIDPIGELRVGDLIHIYGHTTDFTQWIGSMEIDHRRVDAIRPGDEAALLVVERVRRGDEVFKLTGDDLVDPIPGPNL
jgi:hypothetical protein